MISKILHTLKRRMRLRKMFVIIDGEDNSVTLSEALYKEIAKAVEEEAKVFVFRLAGTRKYGFAINPEIDQPTQLADIQYNAKHKCVGFESLNPTVNKMLYDYGLPATKAKLSVERGTAGNVIFYAILPPND